MSPAALPTISGLYIPVHKRTGSSTSSRSSSLARSEASISSQHDISLVPTPDTAHPLIYSRDTLLGLMHSPLARLSPDTRESLRTTFPELITNRRQRKAIEYHAHVHSQTQPQAQAQAPISKPVQPQSPSLAPDHYVQGRNHPFMRVQPRRNRPTGRTPERKRNVTKIVNEATWRGRRFATTPIAV